MLVSRTWKNYRWIIDSAVIERNIQKELISEKAQKRFLYHRKLIHLIAQTFHDIDEAVVESVAIAHFLHFQYLYFSINYEFLPFRIDSGSEAKRALHILEDKSREITFRIIEDQFDNHQVLNNSYRYLNENISQYYRVCAARKKIDKTNYEHLVKPLSSVLYLPVEVFSLVSGDDRDTGILKDGLRYYFLGKMIVMDVVDFKTDANIGAWNYVQSSFLSKMNNEGVIVDGMPAEKKARYFFVSGIAREMYNEAIAYFEKNIDSWKKLTSADLKRFPQLEIRQLRYVIDTLDQLVGKATNKVDRATV